MSNKTIPIANLLASYRFNKSNEDVDRDIIEDLSGNGYNLQLNNFNFQLMSGFGGFAENFKDQTKWQFYNANATYTATDSKVIIHSVGSKTAYVFQLKTVRADYRLKIRIKITNLLEGQAIFLNDWAEGVGTIAVQTFSANGIYDIDHVVKAGYNSSFISSVDFSNGNLTIEQEPLYRGGLVLDGVDDFLQSTIHFPKLNNGYIIICDMDIIENPTIDATGIINKDNISLRCMTDGSFQWYNYSTDQYLSIPDAKLIALTSNNFYLLDGTSDTSELPRTPSMPDYLTIGKSSAGCTKMLIKGLDIYVINKSPFDIYQDKYNEMVNSITAAPIFAYGVLGQNQLLSINSKLNTI